MTVLCYHAVDPRWSAPVSVDPARFASHCAWLAARRRVIPLDVLVSGSRNRRRRRDVALTFDDGFASIFEHALPVLRRYGLPATVFLVAGTLSDDPLAVDWLDRPPPGGPPATLDRNQLLEMRGAGIRFGSHGFSHADLTRLDDDACASDLVQSRGLLEDTFGEPIPFLAYPRGRHDARVRRVARSSGYSHAFALPERREPAGRYSWPRVGVYADNGVGTLRLKVEPSYLPARTVIGSALAGVRRSAALRT